MRIVLKSLLYTFYFIKISWKNYTPLLVYLILSQFLVMLAQNVFLVLLFFIGYLIISAPVVVNIFRNIILDKGIGNNYFEILNIANDKNLKRIIMSLTMSQLGT